MLLQPVTAALTSSLSLDVVEFISLHGDVLTKILISIHTSGEKFLVGWSLDVVELVTLHGDVFTKIFISVHTSGEELNIGRSSGETSSASGIGGDLNESSSGWEGFSV